MPDSTHRGPIVTAAGTGINLALGVLYAWSIFKGAIKQSMEQGGEGAFNWNPASLNDPYAVCCLVFACTMVLAGKCQDHFGPRITATIGGILVGIGFTLASQTTAYWGWIFGFGIFAGAGIAFGYSAATPAALKWYPPNKTGRIAGIVVSGFGLASVYIAPLATYLLLQYGLSNTMLFLGAAFLVVVVALAAFLVNPPATYTPPGFVDRRCESDNNRERRDVFRDENLTLAELLQNSQFWLLWTIFFIGAGAGLMVIGSVAGMAKQSLGANAFMAVAILSVGNAAGRILAGTLSDKIGRKKTLALAFSFQAFLMLGAIYVTGSTSSGPLLIVLLATFIGFNYGANLALFPSFAKDLWGIKHFGVNYGLLFTSWGIGGFVMSRASEVMRVSSGSFSSSFLAAASLLALGTVLIYFIDDHKHAIRKQVRNTQ